MAKYALLIGVSDYGNGYPKLFSPLNDIEALRKVLLNPDKGGFDEVTTLPNCDTVKMEKAILTLFHGRTRDNITLLYFSCHGIRERGEFYFATRATENDEQGNLLTSTALSANRVHSIMSSSSLKKQVVILDCCFSATFADGLLIREKLQEKGRVILTSSTSTQPSFEQEGSPLSIYTRYLVAGINTGEADVDEDGVISIKNLHDYTARKVKEADPRMQPEIYSVQPELLSAISIAKAPIRNPRLRYSREVKLLCPEGEFSRVTRAQLDDLGEELGLSLEDATVIEHEVLKPIQEYKKNLQIFEDDLREEINRVLSE